MDECKEMCYKDILICLVGNKTDLEEKRVISQVDGQKFADDIGAIFQSTSALSDSGITKLFSHIGRKLIDPDYNYKDKDNKAKAKFQNKQKKEVVEETDKKIKLDKNNSEDKPGKSGCCKWWIIYNTII